MGESKVESSFSAYEDFLSTLFPTKITGVEMLSLSNQGSHSETSQDFDSAEQES